MSWRRRTQNFEAGAPWFSCTTGHFLIFHVLWYGCVIALTQLNTLVEQILPPRVLRGSTGPQTTDLGISTPAAISLPQLEMSSRRRIPTSTLTQRPGELHRDLHSHTAVDFIGEGGRAVVTGHVVFDDNTFHTDSPGNAEFHEKYSRSKLTVFSPRKCMFTVFPPEIF